MSKFVVVVFPDGQGAERGRRALDALHDEGALTLFAAAVLIKDAEGKISVEGKEQPGPLGLGLGSLIGGLFGLLGGPAVALFGAAAGAVSGGWLDVLRLGVRGEFLEEVSSRLTAGKAALIAEVTEDRRSPLDMRMEALGGVVFREPRPDFEEDHLEKQVAAEKAALAELEAEHREGEEEIKARLNAQMFAAQAKLKEAADRANAAMKLLEEETRVKIEALDSQAARASADAKAGIERRIASARADHERRLAKLRRAWELTKDALG